MSANAPTSVKNLPPGTLIGYYEVVERVGAGGFGTLYKTNRGKGTFAVKLSTQALRDMEAEERRETELRVGREVSALHALRHPNVVRVHGHDVWPDEEGYPYIVMEFVDGQRLYPWRRSARPSLRLCCRVISKIALALNQLHEVGLFHRDLKSDNVLVKKDGEPVIVDFGIARPLAAETVTRMHTWLGTPRYLAPEYVKYWDTSDFAKGVPFSWAPTTDLYAVGVMFYELVTGASPVKSGSQTEVLLAIKYTTPVAPHVVNPKLPESVSRIVMRLLEKEPGNRVQSGQELFDLFVAAGVAAPGHVLAWDEPLELPDGKAVDGAPVPATPAPERAHKSLSGTVAARPKAAPPLAPPGEESYVATKNVVAVAAGGQAQAPPVAAGERAPTPSMKKPAGVPNAGPPLGEAAGHGVDPAKGAPLFHEPTRGRAAPAASELLSSELRSSLGERADATGAPKGDASFILRRDAVLAGAAEGRPGKRWPLFLASGVLALVIFVLALAWTGRKKPSGPSSLLARVQQDEAARRDAGLDAPSAPAQEEASLARRASPLEGVEASPPRHQAPVEWPERPPLATTPVTVAEATGGRRTAPHREASPNPDEVEITRLEEEAYASRGARPTLPGPSGKRPGQPKRENGASDGPSWLHIAERVDVPGAPSATLGISLGAHVRAKLLTNLDSKTVGDGFVEARLARPFVVRGEVKLPTGTLAYGKGTSAQGRFDIHFTRMVLPGGKELALDGLAYDIAEKRAGLEPSRGATTPKPKQDSKPARILKDTGQVLAGAIGQGDIATEAAQRAAQDTLSDDARDGATSEAASYLDAGADLDIFITQSL